VSEKSSPEILQYEEEAVKELLELLREQEEAARQHATDTIQHQFVFNVYQMEVSSLGWFN
jgi:hypothetical protein